MSKVWILLSLILIVSIPEHRVIAQDSLAQPSHNYGWVDVGVGSLAWSNSDGDGATLSFSHLSDLGLLTLRLIGGKRDLGLPSDYFSANKPYVGEVGALYGRAFRTNLLFASASVGVGVVWGNDVVLSPGNPFVPRNDRFINIGIPAEVQGFVNVFPIIGFGGKISLNLNTRSNFYGWLLCLRVGKIRQIVHPE